MGRLVELAAKWQPCTIVVDEVGPAGSLIAPLEAAELEVLKPSTGRGPPPTAGSLTP